MVLGCLTSLSSWPWWATRYHNHGHLIHRTPAIICIITELLRNGHDCHNQIVWQAKLLYFVLWATFRPRLRMQRTKSGKPSRSLMGWVDFTIEIIFQWKYFVGGLGTLREMLPGWQWVHKSIRAGLCHVKPWRNAQARGDTGAEPKKIHHVKLQS